MFAFREFYVCFYLVIIVIIFFARTCGRHRNFFGDILAIQGELEARGVARCCDSRKHGVISRFLYVHGIFEPVAFAVVAHNDASCLLVKVHASALAVIAIAMVFGIAIIVRGTILALARHVEVFSFNLARDCICRAVFACSTERSLRNRFRTSAVEINFIVHIGTDLEPVEVCIAARLLGRKVEEAPTHAHEHVEVIIELHIVANLFPRATIGAVIEICSTTVNRQVKIDSQINLGVRKIFTCYKSFAILVSAVHHNLVVTAIFCKRDKALVILQSNEARHVSILHALAVNKRTARTLRAKGTLCQSVLCIHDTAIRAARGNAEKSRICRQAPVFVIGVMVELPFESKFARFKIVTRDHAVARERRFRQVDCRRGLGAARRHWPTVFPFHRHQVRHTANRAGIAEQKRIPLAIGSIENATLRNTVIREENSSCISAQEVLRTVNHFGTAGTVRPRNREQIVFAVYLFHVRAFLLHDIAALAGRLVHAHAAELTATATSLHAASVVVQLHVANLVATAVEHPHGAIVIKEQRRVMVERELHFGPLATFHIGGLVQMSFARRVRRGQHVEKSLVVADARCPGALTVGILAAIQILLVIVGKRLVGITHSAPLRQIRALENRHARRKVHGRRDHVISIVNTDNGRVRAIDIHDRVIDLNGCTIHYSKSSQNHSRLRHLTKQSHNHSFPTKAR